MTAAAWLNGAPAAKLALHRGLHYGDGVFRTCLIYKEQVIDIYEHIDVLSRDAQRLDLDLPPGLAAEAAALARGQADGVLKILLMRSPEGRGYRSAGRAADRLLCRYDAVRHPARCWTQGVAIARSSVRLAAQPALAGVKHLNRLEQVLASRRWPEGIDEIILADDHDRPIGGSRTNLFWVRGGALYTPSLQRCGVAGLMRDKVLRAAAGEGVVARVVEGSWDDLLAADEAFLSNSLVGLWPVARLEACAWPAPGPVTASLMNRLSHPRLES